MEDIFDDFAEEVDRNENVEEENDENKEPVENDEDENKQVVKVRRRVYVKRPTLDVMRLTGPRGTELLINITKKTHLRGKGHEVEDLNKIIATLRYWTHVLYPRITFGDCLDKIETLGMKRPTITYLTKMRLGMIDELNDDSEGLSAPSSPPASLSGRVNDQQVLTDEQKERILKNKILAQERRVARLRTMKEQDDAFNALLKS